MATARTAAANVLDAVCTTANAVSTTISTIGKSASYAGNWMDAVLKQQSIKLKVDNEIFEQTYVEQRALELTQARKAIEQYASTDARTKELYEVSLTQLREAVNPSKPQ